MLLMGIDGQCGIAGAFERKFAAYASLKGNRNREWRRHAPGALMLVRQDLVGIAYLLEALVRLLQAVLVLVCSQCNQASQP